MEERVQTTIREMRKKGIPDDVSQIILEQSVTTGEMLNEITKKSLRKGFEEFYKKLEPKLIRAAERGKFEYSTYCDSFNGNWILFFKEMGINIIKDNNYVTFSWR